MQKTVLENLTVGQYHESFAKIISLLSTELPCTSQPNLKHLLKGPSLSMEGWAF